VAIGVGSLAIHPLTMMAVLGLLAHEAASSAPEAGSGPDRHQVLATFSVQPASYELSVACSTSAGKDAGSTGNCSFGVSLVDAGKVIDRVEEFEPPCGRATAVRASRMMGADLDARAWSTTNEHCETDIAARIVELSPNVRGLLVSQRAGFEYAYRSHHLYLARSGRLQRLWAHEEGVDGANWTTATVVSAGRPNEEDVVLIDIERTATGSAARVAAKRIHLERTSGRVVETRLPDLATPLYLVKVGQFRSLAEAMRADAPCLRDLNVFNATAFVKGFSKGFFRGAVLARRSDVKAVLATLAKCPEAPRPTIWQYTSRGMKAIATTE
jgi:hypothetical protein